MCNDFFEGARITAIVDPKCIDQKFLEFKMSPHFHATILIYVF